MTFPGSFSTSFRRRRHRVAGRGAVPGGANSEPIWLIATASYDIYPSLSSMVSFDWYQDYGLPSERKWGSGLYFEIPPYSYCRRAPVHVGSERIRSGRRPLDDFTVTVYDLTAHSSPLCRRTR